jgi:riboflavin kinase/FMN adenylyltransferase
LGSTTVDGQNQSIEIHYFDFNADLYNQEIVFQYYKEFVSGTKIRIVDLLKEQLEKDKKLHCCT